MDMIDLLVFCQNRLR